MKRIHCDCRQLILLAVIIFVCGVVNAAEPEADYDVETIGGEVEPTEGPAWTFRWGPTASVDIAYYGKATSTDPQGADRIRFGCSAGVLARCEWRHRWFVESGLRITYGSSVVDVRLPEGERYHAGDYSYDMKRGAIQMPVHAGYRFRLTDKVGISPFVGTQLSLGFAGSMDYDGSEPLPEYDMYGSGGVWRRFGAAVAFGVHFDMDDMTVGVTGNLGVTRMARRDIFTTHTMNESECRIDFTYWFGRP